jgi:hypothetical protein
MLFFTEFLLSLTRFTPNKSANTNVSEEPILYFIPFTFFCDEGKFHLIANGRNYAKEPFESIRNYLLVFKQTVQSKLATQLSWWFIFAA